MKFLILVLLTGCTALPECKHIHDTINKKRCYHEENNIRYQREQMFNPRY
jgi:hypothetical protein